ncbi:MAG: methyl-accepting chemotaxis protein [Lachnospiraceae bacterium]|nr:methyl-accepting chemotaxis protein [Lachnospiraceae bacterium]
MASSKTKNKTEGKRNVFQSVRVKLVSIIVAIMAIPLIVSVIMSYYIVYDEAVSSMNEMNNAQISLVQHDFKAVVEKNMTALNAVANADSATKILKGSTFPKAINAWLTAVDDEIGDGNCLIIVDAEGNQIVRTVGEPENVYDTAYFQKVLNGELFCVSDEIISENGERTCAFIHAIYDTDGKFLGAVQRNFNLDNFTELMKAELSDKNQDIFIGDNNGDLIAHTSMDLSGGEPVNFSSQKWYTESRSSLEAAGSYDTSFQGKDWAMSYQREPITGWTTVVASDIDDQMAHANMMITIMVIIGVVLLVVAIIISVILANSFTKPIIAVNKAVDKLSGGEFEKLTNKGLVNRKDEFGDIVKNINALIDKLKDVVENIKTASDTVSNQAKELAESANQISGTADDVSNAVQEMAKGATEQANTVENATVNLGSLTDAIEDVANGSEDLAGTADGMSAESEASAKALDQLFENMTKMGSSVTEISTAMEATGLAVQNVNSKVDGITAIAGQTNLLALNASIEAARAGDAGRGFAVVAEEIGLLAKQSATTADEIRKEMENLLVQADEATKKTEEVSKIGDEVNDVLSDTVNKIKTLIGGVDTTVDGVSTIKALTEQCNVAKNEIVDAMSSLSAISEENAASTEETSASMEELNATVNVLAASAGSLDDIAKQLDEELKFFKI